MNEIIPLERIENRIYLIRGQKVIIDRDLAELYGVETFNLNKAVKRNSLRFPHDFMFQLTRDEYQSLRFQFGILEKGKHSKYLPHVFTEQGIAMLSSVLNSDRAVLINIAIMRAFVKLRQVLAANKDLTYLFKELKHKAVPTGRQVDRHDTEIGLIIRAIEKMIAFEAKPKTKIGFNIYKEGK